MGYFRKVVPVYSSNPRGLCHRGTPLVEMLEEVARFAVVISRRAKSTIGWYTMETEEGSLNPLWIHLETYVCENLRQYR